MEDEQVFQQWFGKNWTSTGKGIEIGISFHLTEK